MRLGLAHTRLEDGILITGCGEVWRTKTRPDTDTNSGVWKTLHTELAKPLSENDTRTDTPRLEDGILITGCGEVWKTETRPAKLNTTLASGRRYSEEWKRTQPQRR